MDYMLNFLATKRPQQDCDSQYKVIENTLTPEVYSIFAPAKPYWPNFYGKGHLVLLGIKIDRQHCQQA